MTARTFDLKPAVLSRVPLILGIVGPSNSGKSFSALRLATGIRRVTGGEIKAIDTEHRRMLHYAPRAGEQPGYGKFDFRHVDFEPPYGSLDYLAAIKSASPTDRDVLIVDQMSSEHEGPGGYLEFHEQEIQRLIKPSNQGGGGYKSEYAAGVPAWNKPAQHRSKLIQGILQLGLNAIFCFKAKEKVDMNSKDEDGKRTVSNLGWQPIAGDAFVYEMVQQFLLEPGCRGVPNLNPKTDAEKRLVKCPEQFKDFFKPGEPLSEDLGERMARWAAGSTSSNPGVSKLCQHFLDQYANCQTNESFQETEKQRERDWKKFPLKAEQKLVKDARDRAEERLLAPAAAESDNADFPHGANEPESLFDNPTVNTH